ncbi:MULTISPECIES: glycosyltransferase family 4 protein [Niastella]|uniref:Glycosyltransferase family 4 protein n=1 Tax=Niastella soli TaxID=2821487 RepID=A0ABS3YLQ7_9BACT|nr:glycosyltransferase family 4 protein [Niastella soli]MBO9198824.1 glycosyltransferase family 4 protein [Niastella soli]
MKSSNKLIRITTVPVSLSVLLKDQLRYMSGHFEVLAVSSPDKMLEQVGVREGVRTAPISMTRAITPVKDIKALWKLYRLLKKEKPAIVHTHTPKAGLLGMMASRLAGVPVRMHTVAGMPLMENTGVKRKVLDFVERLTYSCATHVYPNSKVLAGFILENHFCKEQKMKVLGNGSSNGINTRFFQPGEELSNAAIELKKKFGLTEKDFVFVFVGRLVKDKGIEELVAAFSELRKKYPHIKLLLVGPYEPERDPIAPDTRTIIETDQSIVHAGFQQDIRPFLMISQVLAFPSYREGFPNVPMQAGCFNLPSIVTDINGCNEIIEDGKNGLIIPAKNILELKNAMERLLTDPALYLTLQTNARKMIVDRYEQKYLWELLLKEYHDHLKAHAIVS